MNHSTVIRLLLIYLLVLGAACLALHGWMTIRRDVPVPHAVILSVWKNGQRVARHVVAPQDAVARRQQLETTGTSVVPEDLLDEGPILGKSRLLFGASVVPVRDGIQVTYRGRVAYLTPDDLLHIHGYDFETDLFGVSIVLGVDRDAVLDAASHELGVSPAQLLAEAKFRRIAVRRVALTTENAVELNIPSLKRAITAAADYLARQVNSDGTFRYEIDTYTGDVLPGYSWPRHAGATWFLARVAAFTHSEFLADKTRLAAAQLANHATLQCGSHRCIGEGERVDIGSAALTLLAYCQMHNAKLAEGLLPAIHDLAEFLRSQQRTDGEFAHTYDLTQSKAIDEQFPYYTGEAALALSQAHLATGDPNDLKAASAALSYLVERPSLFVTWRYFWAAEHWTCQAVTDLWRRAPSPVGKEFCLAWQRYNRGATSHDPEYAGAAGRYLFRSVPLTGAASSTEAAVATLALSRLTPMPASEVADLERGLRVSLTLLLRHQLLPGPTHLMRQPTIPTGAMPASTSDLRIRIDYPQHSGSAWLGYLLWLENKPWTL